MMDRVFVLLLALSCPLLAFSSPLLPSDLPTTSASENKVIYYFTGEFPDGLKQINPFLTSADLKNVSQGAACANRMPWETCSQYIALFSGLALKGVSKTNGITFLGLTDRGPNVGCDDIADGAADGEDPRWQYAIDNFVIPNSIEEAGKSFPVKRFAPTFFKLKADVSTGKMVMGTSCYLKNSKNEPITGLSNVEGHDDPPYGPTCATGPLAYDQSGIDSEDIQVINGRGHFAIADEYGASIAIVRGFKYGKSCGQVVARYVPRGSKMSSAKAGYPIIEILPSVFGDRRSNRGMENLAVSADGKTLIAMLQSNLDKASPVLTAVRLDITKLTKPKLLGVHLYLMSPSEAPKVTTWDGDSDPKDVKVSGFADAAEILGLKPGTPVVLAIERSKKQVKVYLVDFSKSTNVWGMYGGDNMKFDSLGGYIDTKEALEKMGIKTAQKQLVLNTHLIGDGESEAVAGWLSNDKQEGIAILNKCVIAMGNDNDFGFGAGAADMSVIQLKHCIDYYYRLMQ